MVGVVDRYGAVLAVTILIGFPVGTAAVLALGHWRLHRGLSRSWAWRASIAEVGLVLGTLPWVWMIMTPRAGTGGVSLVPLRDLVSTLHSKDAVIQVGGNLLVLAAVGFFLPIRFRLATPGWVVAAIAGISASLSLLLEILQYALHLGRVSSVDDVLVNTMGAMIACTASRRWWRARQPTALVPSRSDLH